MKHTVLTPEWWSLSDGSPLPGNFFGIGFEWTPMNLQLWHQSIDTILEIRGFDPIEKGWVWEEKGVADGRFIDIGYLASGKSRWEAAGHSNSGRMTLPWHKVDRTILVCDLTDLERASIRDGNKIEALKLIRSRLWLCLSGAKRIMDDYIYECERMRKPLGSAV